jgi:1,4-alpha-glucan branching enzyme
MPSDNLSYGASDLYPVDFEITAPGAKRVTLSGDFNNWKSMPLSDADGDGRWTVSLTLAPGRYLYAFAVDGKKRLDPKAEVERKNGRAMHAVLRL